LHALLVLAGAALLAAPGSAVTIDWIAVGDPGNDPDTASNCSFSPCGTVGYVYSISKYEVTNAQYAEMLNAKAGLFPDLLGLYNEDMGLQPQGGITRSGVPGSFTYTAKPGFESKPVNFVSFYDALRFANWLHNGQGNGDTETGAYTLLGATATPSNGSTVSRNFGATIVLPSQNEWHKAAYYDGLSETYFDYPAGTDAAMTCAAPGATPNTANCGDVVGNVTDVGAYTGSGSPYGTFDQGGNVVEWNENPVGPGRLVQGSHWRGSVLGTGSAVNSGADPTQEFAWSGFRLVMIPVPEPGTSVLVSMGLVGLFSRRRSS
jgi:formylglycine-generating enzyme required for sulfatase activity